MSLSHVIAELVKRGEAGLAEELLSLSSDNEATAAVFSKVAGTLSNVLKALDDAERQVKSVRDPKYKEEVSMFTKEVKPIRKALTEWIQTFRIV